MKLIKFYATWCAPCKALTQVIERNKGEIPEQMEVIEIDVDQDNNSAKEFQVRGVPTMILLDDANKEYRRHVGMLNDQQFKEFLIGRG